ncbi:UDP-2,4-diacetamido-2,4,6-trideoxy-beta-L-altropyranose hydrolase [Neolewinella sp.]|uniref:UDP-2,4-diacetamido-2,4, 6-trideoxy-beta-L-altropyranose hydrolase n=1 Tax=Neolewinella sp. TaxID=2993543 RepID=UPI003B52ECBE
MAKPTVIFRADGHPRMGLGHLVRSAALAEMLMPDFDCFLVYRDCPESLLADWTVFCATTQVAATNSPMADAQFLVDYVTTHGQVQPSIVVLDGYHFDTAYQETILAAGHRLVCIDDIHHTKFVAHLVINHAPAARIDDYRTAPGTHFAFGLRFALLRGPFREAARDRLVRGSSARHGVFVCLGGADPDNATLDVLRQLASASITAPVDVVIGSAYQHEASLAEFLEHTALEVRLHRQLSATQMAALMQASAYGITSPSTVCLEYLSAGGRLYLKQIADNQTEIYQALLKQGLAQDVTSLQRTDPDAGSKITSESHGLLDGQQDVRFRKLFRGLGLSYRQATKADSPTYLTWANDPLVRAQSFNLEEIDPVAHEAWFTRKLQDPHTDLLLFNEGERAVGQVRLQIEGQEAVIGYSVAESARGAGYGLAMLHFAQNHLQRQRSGVNCIVGYVKRSNTPSLITFRRLGYCEADTDDHPDAVKFTLYDL